MIRRRYQRAASLLLAVAIATTSAHASELRDTPRSIEVAAGNILSRINLVQSDLREAVRRERRYPLARRYVDATLAYQRGNYSLSSVLFYDLVMTPKFQRRSDYYNALFMLGTSLYRLRNFFGAQRYLSLIVKFTNRKYFVPTLTALVDIAIRMGKYDLVAQYTTYLGAVPPGSRRAHMFYQFGRSFFVAKKFEQARKFLAQVDPGERDYPAARFYLGVLKVRNKDFKTAMREFESVVQAGQVRDVKRRPRQIVVDYARLSLARLYLEKKDFNKAIDNYVAIDRNSVVAEEALFELAATFVAAKKFKRALDTLDILLLTVSDDKVAVEAAVLRGRINLKRKKYDAADSAYKDVVNRYSAISGELTRFVARPERLEQFFSWLLNRGSDEYSVVRPVSKRVAAYIEKDPDMSRVVRLFDEMSAERRDVKISEKLAQSIETALASNSQLEMYPGLKGNWLKLVEQENKIVGVGDRLIDVLRRYAQPLMSAEQRAEAAALAKKATELRQAFTKIPSTARDWSKRETRIQGIWIRLAAQISLLKSALGAMREQVLAIEKMLNERVYGTEGVSLSKDREALVRKGLEREKDDLRRVYRMVEALAQDVELGATEVGAGDKVSADEGQIRRTLLAIQRLEQSLYTSALSAAGRHSGVASRMRRVRAKLDQGVLQINGLYVSLGKRVAERSAKVRQTLRREKRNIANYKVRMNEYEHASRRLASTVGYELIRRAQTRLSDVVLEADLGLVDVSWQRKQDKANEIQRLNAESKKKIQRLDKTLESLTDNQEGGQ